MTGAGATYIWPIRSSFRGCVKGLRNGFKNLFGGRLIPGVPPVHDLLSNLVQAFCDSTMITVAIIINIVLVNAEKDCVQKAGTTTQQTYNRKPASFSLPLWLLAATLQNLVNTTFAVRKGGYSSISSSSATSSSFQDTSLCTNHNNKGYQKT